MMGTFEKQTGTSVNIVTPLMRLKDPEYTKIILVALPEVTPVSQASALQEDLRRASIEPYAWVLNRSVLAAKPTDPLLVSRLQGEVKQIKRIKEGLSKNLFVIPFQSEPPVGVPVDVKIFRTTPELVLAVVTAPLVTLTAPIAKGSTGSNPP
jgi:arsenite-transporting ATPase